MISDDESFVLSNTNYAANSSILVLGVLKLGPNLTIEFADEYSIIVKEGGELSLDGAELKAQTGCVWGGIVLENSNGTEITISNSIISEAANGLLVKSSGDISIHNSSFKDIKSDAIYIQTSAADQSITLSNISIDHPGNNAIYAESFQGYLSLSTSKITNTAGYGVYVSPYYYYNQNTDVLLDDNDISTYESGGSAIYIYQYYNLTITRNRIKCKALYNQCVYLYDGYETVIEDNDISGVLGSSSYYQLLYIYSYTSSTTSFSLQRNTLSTWVTSGDAVYVDVGQNSGASGYIVLQDNIFYNISAGERFPLLCVHQPHTSLLIAIYMYTHLFQVVSWTSTFEVLPTL